MICLLVSRFLIVILISTVFGALGFLYSFFGLLDQNTKIINIELVSQLTVKEIGGHFIFGFLVTIFSRNLQVTLLTGLMALTIDSDHLLNMAGYHILAGIDHSIPFAILSSTIIGLTAYLLDRNRILLSKANDIIIPLSLKNNNRKVESKQYAEIKKGHFIFIYDNVFREYLSLTLMAFLSHIAYDSFVDYNARFPLLAPFSFIQYTIPQIYGLPIEGVGMLIGYLYYYNQHAKPNKRFLSRG
jgi:hypothetical protein